MRMLYLRFVSSGAGGFSSDMHSSSLTRLWHFLPEASGKICQGFLAKNRTSTRGKNHNQALDRGQNVAGSDPQSPEGFGRTEGPPNGVAPGHGCVFGASFWLRRARRISLRYRRLAITRGRQGGRQRARHCVATWLSI